ncbi:hypothetical protein HYC85_013308 [Camellia sinensis]|uniref:Uncharacterized protein n=1 Tax=Camellia sinensis TaxID=4442 RepID=A0A7J7H549_CAMSI|nr:hypothetical protein HYC85_013308 [Camellia sinensis]
MVSSFPNVLTPYYNEDVLYSEEELKKENEDGITTLFYPQKIYPVRGMMYYRKALELQCFLDYADDRDILSGHRTSDSHKDLREGSQALADLKFTYIVSCQRYGAQKKSSEARDRSCYSNALLTIDMNQCFITRLVHVQSGDKFFDHWPMNFGKPSKVTVLTVCVFLYGRLYLVLSGMEKGILEDAAIHQSKALEEALATQSVFQLGLLLVLPMVMEIGLERGFRTVLGDFVIMKLQLASVFFTFHS